MPCSVCRSMVTVAGVVVFICALLLCFCVLSVQADWNRNIDLPVQDFSCPLCRSYEAEAFNISLYLTLAWNFELAVKCLYVTPAVELKHRVRSPCTLLSVTKLGGWNANRQWCASCHCWNCIVLYCIVLLFMGTAVAQWLRCCATNQKVAGSIPACVSGFFIGIKSFRSHYGPGVDSASNRNEYQEYFLGVKAAGA